MYVPPQTVDGIEGGTEVYEVPDVEAGDAFDLYQYKFDV
jgi:hypothetical protein